MNRLFKYMAMFAASVAVAGVSACQDDIDAPSPEAPVAENVANTTILELKKTFWQDDNNYIAGMENVQDAAFVPVGKREDGSHYIIAGRVISSDEESNVFKSLVIQDETAAIALSINSYNLYLNYRRGQEVVIDVTGMYVGKYNGLLQIGYPEWYENGKCWEASFMSTQFFRSHTELSGLPAVADIDTLSVNSFSELSSTPDGLMAWQSQLVRFNNVEFTNGGKETFSTYKSSGVNQTMTDVDGNSLNVRTSGYSTFWNEKLPEGRGDVVGILSYYGTGGWQVILIDYHGCMNFGNPTVAKGSESNPWTVDEAIVVENGPVTRSGWVTGYIVGAVAPEVSEISGNGDIEWTDKPVMNNTLVIGQTKDTKDIAHSLVVALPEGSKLRQLGNLVDHPENYGKAIKIRGTLEQYMNTYGITGNNGAVGTWEIEGVDPGTSGGGITPGDGSEAKPWSAAQVIANQASGTAWVRGYIVGSSNGKSASDFKPGAADPSESNIFIANTPDETDYKNCVPVQLPSGTVRTALNLKSHPENVGKAVSVYGSIEKYFGQQGVKSTSKFSLDGGTPDQPDQPVDPVTSIDQNFDASTDIPAGWSQMQVEGTKAWYIPTFSGNNYAAMTGYKGTAPFDSWLFTPPVDIAKCQNKVLTFDTQVNGYGSTTTVFEVYVLNAPDPAKATLKTRLDPALATAPASGYSSWVASGNLDLSKYSGNIYIGFRYYATQDANYATWCVDNVKLNASGTSPDNPDQPTGDYKGDFNSFNGGSPKASPYGTYTNATGWTAENAIILSGGDTDANPIFTFIGAKGTLAPTIKGTVGSVGSLTSPKLTGGIGTLTFKYGFAFSESKAAFKVEVLDASGNVVKEDTVTLDKIETKKAFDYSLAVNYSGDFSIKITNLAYSGTPSGNKDRVSIWNLTWTNP